MLCLEDSVLRVPTHAIEALFALANGLHHDGTSSVAMSAFPSARTPSRAPSVAGSAAPPLAAHLPAIVESSRARPPPLSRASSKSSLALAPAKSSLTVAAKDHGRTPSKSSLVPARDAARTPLRTLSKSARVQAPDEECAPAATPSKAARDAERRPPATLTPSKSGRMPSASPTPSRSGRAQARDAEGTPADASTSRGSSRPKADGTYSFKLGATKGGSDRRSNRFGEEVSKRLGKLGQGKRSVAGSQPSLSRQSTTPIESPPPQVPEDVLAARFDEAGIEGAADAAKAVLLLLGVEELDVAQMERVYRHHKLRQFNIASRVVLQVVLVRHGDSDQSGQAVEAGAPERELVAEGWRQVTRTAWAVRLQQDWHPTLALTSTSRCCTQTAERVLSVLAEEEEEQPTLSALMLSSPPSRRRPTLLSRRPPISGCTTPGSCRASRLPSPRRPVARSAVESTMLDYPTVDAAGSLDLVARFRRVSGALLAAATEAAGPELASPWSIGPDGSVREPLTKPPKALLVLGGFLLETVIACLTAQTKRSYNDPMPKRIYGGDAVFLKSSYLCQIVGEEPNYRLRSMSELWEEALMRGDWKIVEHLHGDGRNDPATGGSSASRAGALARQELAPLSMEGWYNEDTGKRWRGYVGEPLVWGPSEWDFLFHRSGSVLQTVPLNVMRSLAPCVKDYEIPEEPLDLDTVRPFAAACDLDDEELMLEAPT